MCRRYGSPRQRRRRRLAVPQCGIGLREKYSAAPSARRVTFTTAGSRHASSVPTGAATVPMSNPAHLRHRRRDVRPPHERLVALHVHHDVVARVLRPRHDLRDPRRARRVRRRRQHRLRAPAPRTPPRSRRRPSPRPPVQQRKEETRRHTHSSSGLPASGCSGLRGSRSDPSRAGITPRIRSLRTGRRKGGARRDAKFTPKQARCAPWAGRARHPP
jgi:hypothetical protein